MMFGLLERSSRKERQLVPVASGSLIRFASQVCAPVGQSLRTRVILRPRDKVFLHRLTATPDLLCSGERHSSPKTRGTMEFEGKSEPEAETPLVNGVAPGMN